MDLSTNITYEWYESNVSVIGNSELTFILPIWRQVIWCLLFGTMVVIAFIGNLFVVWIVFMNKRMRTVTNYFLVNLSIADATATIFNVIFNFIYMLYSDWPFGTWYCKFTQFVAVVSIAASVFTLIAISADRYLAIMSPLQPRLGKRLTLAIIGFIWFSSCIISIPNLLYFTTSMDDTTNRTICYSEWPDGVMYSSRQEYYYNIFFTMITYFLPMGLISYAYAKIGNELWSSHAIGEITERQMENVNSKRRIVKMMIIVVIMFAVCWLPFHVYFILTAHFPSVMHYKYTQEIFLAIYWLAMSNSMYNPIIYCWMNSKFRRGFRQFIWCFSKRASLQNLSRRSFINQPERSARRSLSPIRRNDIGRHSNLSGYSTVGTSA